MSQIDELLNLNDDAQKWRTLVHYSLELSKIALLLTNTVVAAKVFRYITKKVFGNTTNASSQVELTQLELDSESDSESDNEVLIKPSGDAAKAAYVNKFFDIDLKTK